MSQGGFLQNLVNFPKDTINEEAVELLLPYLQMEDYNLATAKKVVNISSLQNCSISTKPPPGRTKTLRVFLKITEEKVLPFQRQLQTVRLFSLLG